MVWNADFSALISSTVTNFVELQKYIVPCPQVCRDRWSPLQRGAVAGAAAVLAMLLWALVGSVCPRLAPGRSATSLWLEPPGRPWRRDVAGRIEEANKFLALYAPDQTRAVLEAVSKRVFDEAGVQVHLLVQFKQNLFDSISALRGRFTYCVPFQLNKAKIDHFH